MSGASGAIYAKVLLIDYNNCIIKLKSRCFMSDNANVPKQIKHPDYKIYSNFKPEGSTAAASGWLF